jgi:DNA-binding transcriptional regulator YiaG
MAKEFWSEASQVNYEGAEGLHKIGLMSDAELKEFADICIKPEVPPMATSRVAVSSARAQRPLPAYADAVRH